jgi:hypothetical protein
MQKERKDHNLFTMSGNCNITVEISELGGVWGRGKPNCYLYFSSSQLFQIRRAKLTYKGNCCGTTSHKTKGPYS